VNGANQPAGTTWVHAEIDGVLYGQDSTASPTSGGGYSGSEYALDVTGDQFEVTDPKQGGVNGDNIIFWVLTGGGANRYVASQRGVFQEGGGPTTLDLAVTTGTNPASWPLISEVNPSNATDWVELYNDGPLDLALTPQWSLVSEATETAVSLDGITVPAGDFSAPINMTDQTFLDDPVAGDVLKIVLTTGGLATGAPVVVDRVEWGNPNKPTDAMGRAKEVGATTCIPDIPSGRCVWDVNVVGAGSGQALVAGQSLHRSVPVDTDRYLDWTAGPSTPVWASTNPPSITVSSPVAGDRPAHNQPQTVFWNLTDADDAPAALRVWVNYSVSGPAGPWLAITPLTGVAGTTTLYAWTPNPPCTPGSDLPNSYVQGEVEDPARNRGVSLVGPIRIDCTPPAVTATIPLDNTEVAPNVNIIITFSEPMRQAATNSAFRLDTVPVPGADITWDTPTQVTIVHAPWAGGSGHAFDITCAAVDAATPNGSALSGCPYTWNWTVSAGNTPPGITLTEPVGGAIWSMNSAHVVNWSLTDGQDTDAQMTVRLDYSNDGGTNWFLIVASRQGDLRPYPWSTPSSNCGNIAVRGTVTDSGGLNATSTSPTLTLDCIPPGVFSTDPPDGDLSVSVVRSVRITFTEPMDPLPTQSAVGIAPNQPPGLAFDSFSWNPGFTVLTLGHSLNFDPGQSYTVTVRCTPFAAAAQDRSDPGNTLGGCPSPYTFSFTTSVGNSSPEILVTTPAGGERWSANSAHSLNWTMNDDNGTSALNVDLAYRVGSGPLIPIQNNLIGVFGFLWTLPCQDSAAVTLNATVMDDGGLQDWFVTPAFALDCTPPAIASTTPIDDASGVSPVDPVVITFSEAMNNATLAPTCGITFNPSVGPVTYLWSNGNTTLTVTHNGMAVNTGYVVSVCAGIRDTSDPGLTLAPPDSFNFTTGVVGNSPPQVSVTAPTLGASFVRGQGIPIAWTMSDLESPAASLTVYVNYSYNGSASTGAVSGPLTGATGTTWTAPAITAGDVTVRVTVLDPGGASAFADSPEFSISPDVVPPTISGIGITPASPVVGDGVTFTCEGCTDNSGTITIQWRVLDSSGNLIPSGTGSGASFVFFFTTPGTYTVNVTATDPSGNRAWEERTVTVSAGGQSGGFPWWAVVPVVAGVLLLLFLLWRRKKEPAEEAPPPEAPPPEEAPAPEEIPAPEEFPPPSEAPPEEPPGETRVEGLSGEPPFS